MVHGFISLFKTTCQLLLYFRHFKCIFALFNRGQDSASRTRLMAALNKVLWGRSFYLRCFQSSQNHCHFLSNSSISLMQCGSLLRSEERHLCEQANSSAPQNPAFSFVSSSLNRVRSTRKYLSPCTMGLRTSPSSS